MSQASDDQGSETEPAHRLAAFASSRGRYYAIFLAIFCAVLIISNISATKVIGFGPIVTDGGAFLFPIATSSATSSARSTVSRPPARP